MHKTLKLATCDPILSTDVCNLRTNADLTLILRLGFRQINPAAGAASGTYNDYGDPARKARTIVNGTRKAGQRGNRISAALPNGSGMASSGC